MENAGRNAADQICDNLSQAGRHAVAVVAGGGNNGGDGFVIARHLFARGATVAVFLVADQTRMSPDAAVHFDIIHRLGLDIRVRTGQAVGSLARELQHFEVVVDALGGTGVTGPLRDDLAAAVEQINAARRPVVAVDIPTGLDCDTGQPLGPTVKADMTVTFVARKVGFDSPAAAAYTGKIIVADIGVPYQA